MADETHILAPRRTTHYPPPRRRNERKSQSRKALRCNLGILARNGSQKGGPGKTFPGTEREPCCAKQTQFAVGQMKANWFSGKGLRGEWQIVRRRKQSQCQRAHPRAGANRQSLAMAAGPEESIAPNEPNWAAAKMNVSCFSGKDYGNLRVLGAGRNKACAKVSWCNSAGMNPARPKLADRPE